MMTVVSRLWLMSLQACPLILIVLLARVLLKKYPKVLSYSLWILVGLRLLCPIFVESPFSLQPNLATPSEVISEQKDVLPDSDKGTSPDKWENTEMNQVTEADSDNTEKDILQNVEPGMVQDKVSVDAVKQENNLPIDIAGKDSTSSIFSDSKAILIFVYMSGVVLFAGSYLVSYFLMKKKLKTAVKKDEGIWLSDRIPSPFVMGIFSPRIMLPYGLSEKEEHYILLHEKVHIKHHDSLIRGIGILCLCLHWWNPFVWLAVYFMGKDMEMFCDETALKSTDAEGRKAYAETLLCFAVRRSGLSLGLAFGESNAEQRIRNILKNKKRSKLIFGIVVVVAFLCALAFLTIPTQETGGEPEPTEIPVPTEMSTPPIQKPTEQPVPTETVTPSIPKPTEQPQKDTPTVVKKKQAHVFARNDVLAKHPEPECSLERMSEEGTVRTLKGCGPGAAEGTWYIIEYHGVMYYWFCPDGKPVEEAELYSYALVEKVHILINGLQVTMTKDEVLRLYPDMAIVDIKGEAVENNPEWSLEFNSVAFPHSHAGQEKNFNYGEDDIWFWQEQFDYCMLAEIEGESRNGRAMALALMMKNDTVEAITFYCPNDGSIVPSEWNLDISTAYGYECEVPAAVKFPSVLLDNPVEEGSPEEETLLAYQNILYALFYDNKMPDDSESDLIYDISYDRFSICDVDSDGRDELMIIHSATRGGQIRTYILEYHPETDTLHEESVIYPGGTKHANGIIVSVAERNHSYASFRPERSLVPYSIYQYEKETDTYQFVMEVSAWDKYCHSFAFPESADLDGDGMVYCFTPDGRWQDGAAYEEWFAETFDELAKVKGDASWRPLTKENIEALTKK